MTDENYEEEMTLKPNGYVFFELPEEEEGDLPQIGVEAADIFYDPNQCNALNVSFSGIGFEVDAELNRLGLIQVMENVFETLKRGEGEMDKCIAALEASPYFVRLPPPPMAGQL